MGSCSSGLDSFAPSRTDGTSLLAAQRAAGTGWIPTSSGRFPQSNSGPVAPCDRSILPVCWLPEADSRQGQTAKESRPCGVRP